MSGMNQAAERILALADEGSFTEFGKEVTMRSTDFDLSIPKEAGDGVVTGIATVGGTPVAVYSQDRTVLNGSFGEMHAKKILNLYEFALKTGLPVVGMLDSAGVRLEEATDALEAFGELYRMKAKASGAILQIDLVFGRTGGMAAVAAGLSDFVLMENSAELFVNAPNTLPGNFEEKLNTASASYRAEAAGDVSFTGTEEELISFTKELLGLLPANCEELAVGESADDLNRMTPELEGETSAKAFAAALGDGERFTEMKPSYAPDMITGFIKLDGMTTAVVANGSDALTAAGLRKAAEFVRFADAFDLPLVTLSHAVRLEASEEGEKALLREADALVSALSSSTVPKVNVVIGDMIGNAYLIMNSKASGADIVYALDGVKIGLMDGSAARKILSDGGEEAARKFEEKQTVRQAAKRGYVDEIVAARSLRKKVLIAMEILSAKRGEPIAKKHAGK